MFLVLQAKQSGLINSRRFQEYQAMSALFNKHESKGFDILAFPCNQATTRLIVIKLSE